MYHRLNRSTARSHDRILLKHLLLLDAIGSKIRSIFLISISSCLQRQMPTFNPARNIAPSADESVTLPRSTGSPVRSANVWQMKSFRETPPSTLIRVNVYRVSFSAHTYSSAIRYARLSRIARTRCSFRVDALMPMNPVPAVSSRIGGCKSKYLEMCLESVVLDRILPGH